MSLQHVFLGSKSGKSGMCENAREIVAITNNKSVNLYFKLHEIAPQIVAITNKQITNNK